MDEELQLYREAINSIDDYFEYRNESVKDREFIHKVLDKLCKDIIQLQTDDINKEG